MNASATSFPPPGISSRRANFGGQLTSTQDGAPAAPVASPAVARPQQQQRQTPPHQQHQQQSKGKGKAKPAPKQQQQQQPANAAPSPVAVVEQAAQEEEEEIDEADMCFICAEKATLWAVGECGHRTCHTCSIRLRALYKKRECTFCKTVCDRVIFTESATLPYSAYPPAAIPFTDTRLGLAFETRAQMDSSISLLRFNCPSPTCDSVLQSWPDLKRHCRTTHQTSICDLCSYHKKIFSHEHSLYTPKEMSRHMTEDHTLCEFCRKSFYDADALYKHCREAHEECFLCVQAGVRHQYHLNYNQLEAHFIATHHPCPHPTCLAQKFVVFGTELDLQAHAVEVHGASLSDQKSRKDARRVETNFQTSYQQVESGRRGGGGGGGGRDARRERERREQEVGSQAAFVRTEEGGRTNGGGERVVPGLGGRRAGFGAGLTLEQPPHQQQGGGRNGNASASGSGSGASTPRTDPVVQERHEAVMRRVKQAVNGSEAKVTSFKLAVRSYRANEVSSDDLIDQLWNIFDQKQDIAGPIITGLADLFVQEDPEKRTSLLSAWEGLRAEQNHFPTLAPLAPALNGIPTASPSNPSSRGLNNRNSRNQRGGGTPAVWDRVAQAAAAPAQARANPFPSLAGGSSVPGMPRPKARATPWAGSSATPSGSAPPSRGSTPLPPSRPQPISLPPPPRLSASTLRPPPAQSGHAFPALPSSNVEAERRARVRAALGRPGVTVDDVSPGVEGAGGSAWGGGSAGTSRSGSPEGGFPGLNGAAGQQQGGGNGGGGGGGGKKKKGKVLLMSHGVLRG